MQKINKTMLTLDEAGLMLKLVAQAIFERVGPANWPGRNRVEELTPHQYSLLQEMAHAAIVTALELNKAFMAGKTVTATTGMSQPVNDPEISGTGYNVLAEVEILLGKQPFYGSEN